MLLQVREVLQANSPRDIVEPSARQAAVSLIIVPTADDVEMLFMKRAEHPRDPWSGQMGLPGGRRDEADATLADTAIRETGEEVGIGLTGDTMLGRLDDHRPTAKLLPPIVVRPFIFGLSSRPAVSANEEVDLFLWISLSQLLDNEGMAEVEVRGDRWSVPAYVVDSHVIWGMTHRIIKPFLDLVNTFR